jgi:hypothetical protein
MRDRCTGILTAICALLLPACSSQATNDSPSPADREPSQGSVQQLESDLRALAKQDGCESGGQCKAVPVGAKPCGGPRLYLAYCPLTTDEEALTQKAEELRRAEEAHNRQQGLVSDCMFVAEPQLDVVDGRCQIPQALMQPQ